MFYLFYMKIGALWLYMKEKLTGVWPDLDSLPSSSCINLPDKILIKKTYRCPEIGICLGLNKWGVYVVWKINAEAEVTASPEPVFKINRWKIPELTTELTFLLVDSKSRLILWIYSSALFMKKDGFPRISKKNFQNGNSYYKKRRVCSTLLQKLFNENPGNGYKRSQLAKSQCISAPNPLKLCSWMFKSRLFPAFLCIEYRLCWVLSVGVPNTPVRYTYREMLNNWQNLVAETLYVRVYSHKRTHEARSNLMNNQKHILLCLCMGVQQRIPIPDQWHRRCPARKVSSTCGDALGKATDATGPVGEEVWGVCCQR